MAVSKNVPNLYSAKFGILSITSVLGMISSRSFNLSFFTPFQAGINYIFAASAASSLCFSITHLITPLLRHYTWSDCVLVLSATTSSNHKLCCPPEQQLDLTPNLFLSSSVPSTLLGYLPGPLSYPVSFRPSRITSTRASWCMS